MNEKIVYTYVVADLMHVGHISYLENAQNFGDKLIIGVLTDKATMEKKSKPSIPFAERIRVVKALRCVDLVIAQETYSPIHNIKQIKPDIVIESDSHTEESINEVRNVVESYGGKVIVLPYYSEQSSTNLKNNIVDNWKPKTNNNFPKQGEDNQCGL